MFEFIYRLPLTYVAATMIILIIVWGYLYFSVQIKGYGCKPSAEIKFTVFNVIALIFSIYIILEFTILGRNNYVDKLVLEPFYSISIARNQPEMYRSLLMNIVLFIPLGSSIACILSKRIPYIVRIGATFLSGCVLSALIESIQYFYKLGEAWTDDVICNALGAFVGSCAIVVWKVINFKKHDYT